VIDFSKRTVDIPNMDKINAIIPKGIGVFDVEGKRLAKLAVGRKVIVEIGAHRGRSAAFMASGLRYSNTDGMIYSVDHWFEGQHLDAYKSGLERLQLNRHTTPLRGASEDIVKTWDKPIDFLFIDGNHSYFHVKQDYRLWSPFVVKGGLIAFHDYGNPGWEGVRRFVDTIPDSDLHCIGVHHSLWSGVKS